ncbi:hypothetical protein GS399_02100 [Pedobacter sp. HMF7647]|uniref:Lipoprotein n=1 Tax=Hufsiella arboris TaxID=2695275 RepID=A0A7K1Y582_9SPHI|nr:hypothetical protein [Hufsiella arboris]MXV49747.1 hypothetical protein [Hufsiella arboris]
MISFKQTAACLGFAMILAISCSQPAKHERAGQDSLTATTSIESGPADDSIPPSRSIIPGDRIGLTRLNDRADSIVNNLGKPDSGDAAMGKSVSYWFSKPRKEVTMVYFTTNMGAPNAVPRAKQVSVTSSFFTTKSKVSTGASLDFIKKKFPLLKILGEYSDKARKISVYNDPSGIAFNVDDSGRCIAITIYEAGKDPSQTYLSIHPGWKKQG